MECENKPKIQLCGTANIGSKGQIVIPKQARDMLGLEPGDSVSIVIHDNTAIGIVPNHSIDNLMKYINDQDTIEIIN